MTDLPKPDNTPPEIGTQGEWQPNTGMDTAARIPYSRFYYDLPKISAGKRIFVWPSGIEGLRRSGSSTLGIHKFLGRDFVSVSEVHKDEAHIEMSGTFAGRTSRNNMIDLINVLIAPGAKSLYLPGALRNVQKVYCLDYDFSHAADDMTHSFDYTITFVRTLVGPTIQARSQAASLANLSSQPRSNQSAAVKNTSERTIAVKDGNLTLRAIANSVYGDPNQWKTLLDLNANVFNTYNPQYSTVNPFQLALARLPLGTVLQY
jgi:hypothetical protein